MSGKKKKTTIISHNGLYIFLRMSLGLKNAWNTFQTRINIVLSTTKSSFPFVYLDDVVIFLRAAEEHLYHLQPVLGLLSRAGKSLSLKKGFFYGDQIDNLASITQPDRLGNATIETNNM